MRGVEVLQLRLFADVFICLADAASTIRVPSATSIARRAAPKGMKGRGRRTPLPAGHCLGIGMGRAFGHAGLHDLARVRAAINRNRAVRETFRAQLVGHAMAASTES